MPVNLTPGERSARARQAAHVRWANTTAAEASRAARDREARKWESLADPDGVLSVEDRARKAEHLKKAHFANLALKSSKARRAKKAGVSADLVADRPQGSDRVAS